MNYIIVIHMQSLHMFFDIYVHYVYTYIHREQQHKHMLLNIFNNIVAYK